MLAFIGIVVESDLSQGIIEPSYYLCVNNHQFEGKSGMVVVRANGMLSGMNKLLVNSFTGNQDLIEFLANFRSRENQSDLDGEIRNTRKYRPVGALFYFPCDVYGRRNDDPAVFITRIPMRTGGVDQGMHRMRKVQEKMQDPFVALTTDKNMYDLPESQVKIAIPQVSRLPEEEAK